MNNKSNTYVCSICHNINHVCRFHCSCCGTIPAMYSWRNIPIRFRPDTIVSFNPIETISNTIPVVVAFGCSRVEHYKQSKANLRTVPLDYYAT